MAAHPKSTVIAILRFKRGAYGEQQRMRRERKRKDSLTVQSKMAERSLAPQSGRGNPHASCRRHSRKRTCLIVVRRHRRRSHHRMISGDLNMRDRLGSGKMPGARARYDGKACNGQRAETLAMNILQVFEATRLSGDGRSVLMICRWKDRRPSEHRKTSQCKRDLQAPPGLAKPATTVQCDRAREG